MNPKTICASLHAPLMAAFTFLSVQQAPAQEPAAADGSKPMLRLLCASSLGETHHVMVATKNDQGVWKGLAHANLRQSFVSDWTPVNAGELHIAVREEGKMKSLCQFTYPDGARRLLVALHANPDSHTYSAHAIDPDKEGFTQGAVLVINASGRSSTVSLGSKRFTVEADKNLVAKAGPEESGGYRITVAIAEGEGGGNLCYDKQVIPNPNSRTTLILLPDPDLFIRVTNFSEFGPFD